MSQEPETAETLEIQNGYEDQNISRNNSGLPFNRDGTTSMCEAETEDENRYTLEVLKCVAAAESHSIVPIREDDLEITYKSATDREYRERPVIIAKTDPNYKAKSHGGIEDKTTVASTANKENPPTILKSQVEERKPSRRSLKDYCKLIWSCFKAEE